MNTAKGSPHSPAYSENELQCGTNKTCREEGEAPSPDSLLFWSWFIVCGVVLVGFVSNLIVISAICCMKRFHRSEIIALKFHSFKLNFVRLFL